MAKAPVTSALTSCQHLLRPSQKKCANNIAVLFCFIVTMVTQMPVLFPKLSEMYFICRRAEDAVVAAALLCQKHERSEVIVHRLPSRLTSG